MAEVMLSAGQDTALSSLRLPAGVQLLGLEGCTLSLAGHGLVTPLVTLTAAPSSATLSEEHGLHGLNAQNLLLILLGARSSSSGCQHGGFE